MGNCLPSKSLKKTNCTIVQLIFLGFLRQSATKIMAKTALGAILYFYTLPPLSNVEKERAKLASSHVMGSQLCIGGRGIFTHKF